MKKYYSKIKENKLLHCVVNVDDFDDFDERLDISDPSEFLQISLVKSKNRKVKAHKHLKCDRSVNSTQETCIVLSGKAVFSMYDLDGTWISDEILNAGDSFITFAGGHALETLDEETCIYEIKNGPYEGVEMDKEYLKGINDEK